MSEEKNEIEEVLEVEKQTVPSQNIVEQTAGLHELESLAIINPAIVNDPEYIALMEKANSLKSKSKGAKPIDIEEDEVEIEEDEEDDDDDEQETKDSNPFFAEKPKKKAKEIPIDFEVPQELTEMLKSNFGVNDLPTFINSVQTWRSQAQEGNELKTQHEALTSDLQALPYEIKAQIDAWSNGDNFLDVVKNMTRLDFDVDFSSQKIETLVQHYLPEEYEELLAEFNKESITEEELDKQIALLGKTTKRFFDKDKKAVKEQRDDYAKRIAEKQTAFKNSALVSVESFGKTYPNFSKTELNKVRNVLVEGKLENIFYNPDGTYTDNAAEYIAFALNGKKILDDMENRGKRKGISETAMQIVDKSPKSIKKNSQSHVEKKPDLGVVAHLSGMFEQDPYANRAK